MSPPPPTRPPRDGRAAGTHRTGPVPPAPALPPAAPARPRQRSWSGAEGRRGLDSDSPPPERVEALARAVKGELEGIAAESAATDAELRQQLVSTMGRLEGVVARVDQHAERQLAWAEERVALHREIGDLKARVAGLEARIAAVEAGDRAEAAKAGTGAARPVAAIWSAATTLVVGTAAAIIARLLGIDVPGLSLPH